MRKYIGTAPTDQDAGWDAGCWVRIKEAGDGKFQLGADVLAGQHLYLGNDGRLYPEEKEV